MIKPISDLSENELRGKKVLLRVDFNVPVAEGRAAETYRLKTNREAIDFLTGKGAITVLVSHITAVESFETILEQIRENLGRELIFAKNLEELEEKLAAANPGEIFLLDNVRQYEGEEKNDTAFAEKLAKPFDIYVNNAFSVSHRAHASLTSITKLLLSYGGPLLVKEIENLGKAMALPTEGKTLIIAGAKVGTKLPVIENFLDKAENIIIGGVLANVFLKAKGIDIGRSIVDDDYLPHAKKFLKIYSELMIPDDFIIRDGMILDIGPNTIAKFVGVIKKSKTIIWNGPMGKAETPELAVGTKQIAEAIADSGAFSVVGGGGAVVALCKDWIILKKKYHAT